MSQSNRYAVARLNELPAVPCPCGTARRAFANATDGEASIHLVELSEEAKTHYHKRQTEIYYILEGTGLVELDGESVDVTPGDAILIKPGCRHRAIGELKILNVVIPTFDPSDEWFD